LLLDQQPKEPGEVEFMVKFELMDQWCQWLPILERDKNLVPTISLL